MMGTATKASKLRQALESSGQYRAALAGLVDAVSVMVEQEDSDDLREIELAAVGLKQAFEMATIALGGEGWEEWGQWVALSPEIPGLSEELRPDRVFRNNLFEVWVTISPMFGEKDGLPVAEMSVKRRDKLPIDHNHWRILQRIKSELLGSVADGAMLYPAEDRLQDSANQYRIYALPPGQRWPFGDTQQRMVSSKALLSDDNPRNGGRQRPINPKERPDDDLAGDSERLEAVERFMEDIVNIPEGEE